VQIPGFRRGKAPVSVLENKLGESLRRDAFQKIVGDALDEVGKQDDFDKNFLPLPYSEPKIEEMDTPTNFDTELTISTTYDVMPQFTVENWKGLSVQADTAELTDDDINKELEELRIRNALVMDKDAGEPAVFGDIACIDYAELDGEGGNGRPIDGTKRDDWVFTIGSSNGSLCFDDDIVGMKVGEKRVIKKDLVNAGVTAQAEEDNVTSAETVPATFEVTLKSLKKRELFDLDDEFAQDIDEKYKTLDDLKASIKATLEKQLAAVEKSRKLDAIYLALIEKNPVDIPESMIKMGTVSHFRDVALDVRLTMEQAKRYVTPAIEESLRSIVVKNIHVSLIMQKLADELKLELQEDDFLAAMEEFANVTGSTLDEVKKYYEDEDARSALVNKLMQKTLNDILLKENTVTAGKRLTFSEILKQADGEW
jgi:trigger factor